MAVYRCLTLHTTKPEKKYDTNAIIPMFGIMYTILFFIIPTIPSGFIIGFTALKREVIAATIVVECERGGE